MLLLKSTVPKNEFPRLLKELLEVLNSENLKSGSKASGIYPFCPHELLKKLQPENNQDQSLANVSTSVLDYLKLLKNPKLHQKRKRIDVESGKSICQSDLELESESDSESFRHLMKILLLMNFLKKTHLMKVRNQRTISI